MTKQKKFYICGSRPEENGGGHIATVQGSMIKALNAANKLSSLGYKDIRVLHAKEFTGHITNNR